MQRSLVVAAGTLILGATCMVVVWSARRSAGGQAAVTATLGLAPALLVLLWARVRRPPMPRGALLIGGAAAAGIYTPLANGADITCVWLGSVIAGAMIVGGDVARFEHAGERRSLFHALVIGGVWLLVVSTVAACDLGLFLNPRPLVKSGVAWFSAGGCAALGLGMIAGGAGSELLLGSALPRRLGHSPARIPSLASVAWRGIGLLLLAMFGTLGALAVAQPQRALLLLPPTCVFAAAALAALPLSGGLLVARATDRQDPKPPEV